MSSLHHLDLKFGPVRRGPRHEKDEIRVWDVVHELRVFIPFHKRTSVLLSLLRSSARNSRVTHGLEIECNPAPQGRYRIRLSDGVNEWHHVSSSVLGSKTGLRVEVLPGPSQ